MKRTAQDPPPTRPAATLALATALSMVLPQNSRATTPVEYEDEGWLYDDSGVDPGAAWMDPGFDDGGWSQGMAELGFGEGDEGTELNNHGGYSYYARHTFEISDASDIVAGTLDLVYDDGAVVYINGIEVDRFDLPAGPITHTTGATSPTGPEREVSGQYVDPALLVNGENVLAIGVHQYDPASSDVSLDAELCFDVDRGPYLLGVDADSVTVMWGSCVDGDSTVEYGPTPAYGSSEVDATATTLHRIELTGLASDSLVHYRVSSGGVVGVDHVFRTAPAAGTDFSFAYYADTREGTAIHAEIAALIAAEIPSLVIHGGDMVNNGPSWSQWGEYFFDPADPLLPDAPLFPLPGNHEGPFDPPLTWYDDLFPPDVAGELYYSFGWGDVRFIVADTNDPDLVGVDPESSAQYLWLESELASAVEPILIVAQHHPAYSSGWHGDDAAVLTIQQSLLPLYEQYGVDALLCAHEHFYERSFDGSIHQLTVGGGGAALAPYTPLANPHQVFQADDTCYAIMEVAGGEIWTTIYDGDGVLLEPDTFLLTDDAPTLSLDPLDTCARADEELEVGWADDDPDGDALIEFWLDLDDTECGGEAVGVGYSEDDPVDTASLDVSIVPNGVYHLCAVISDELHEVEVYASETVRIYHPVIGAGDEVVAMGSSWRYLDPAAFPGWNWKGPNFDDSSWSEGCAELGYGEDDERTTLDYGPDPADKYPTAYFRTTFELTNPLPSRLLIEIVADDGAVLWLNGHRVRRFNMPGGAVNYDTLAGSHREGAPAAPRPIPVWANNWFVAGDNVLAVEIHQAGVQSSDLSFDLRVIAIP
jgi:hypothetical protein